jgi:hypothetical protein
MKGNFARGLIKGLANQSVFKRRAPDKLAGFFRSPTKRTVFKPLTYAPFRPSDR